MKPQTKTQEEKTMKIPVRFTYKVYPHSPKATDMSKKLNAFTCGAMTAVMAFFWWLIWYMILAFALNGIISTVETLALVSLATLVVFFILRAVIKKKLEAKIDEIARTDAQNQFIRNSNRNHF